MIFRQTARFAAKAARLLTDADLIALEILLLEKPDRGAVIKGGFGLRKLRGKRGKHGGARVIYLHVADDESIPLADIYTKKEKSDLTDNETKTLKDETDA